MTNKTNTFENIEALRSNEVFKTPEGYFDTLTSRIMAHIPEEETESNKAGNVIEMKPRTKTNWYVWSSVAACFIAIVGIATIYTSNKQDDATALEDGMFYIAEDDYQEAMDYSLVDGHDVYCYLSGAEY